MKDYLTLGVIAAIVAGDAKAVEDLLRSLAGTDPKWAGEVLEAMKRGVTAKSPR